MDYQDLAAHDGHSLKLESYERGKHLSVRCKTCDCEIKTFERPDVWAAEEGDGFMALDTVLYYNVPSLQRFNLPKEVFDLQLGDDIKPGQKAEILTPYEPNDPALIGLIAEVVKVVSLDDCQVKDGDLTVYAKVRPIPTQAQHESVTHLYSALRELLNCVNHDNPGYRSEIRTAYLAIARASGLDVSAYENDD